MSSQTQNLHLIKPASDDTADIGIINSNMDAIDAAVADRVIANYTIETGSDLNDQEPGGCWWGSTFSNAPNSSAGWMQVTRIGQYQLAFTHAGNAAAPSAFLRSYVNEIWQPWARLDGGEYKYNDVSSAVSVPNSSYKTIASIALTPGTWVVNFHVNYASNTTGYRFIAISDTDNSSSAGWNRWSGIQLSPSSGGNTYLGTMLILNPGTNKTYYGVGWQNSGSALNAAGEIEAVRIR